MVVEDEPSILEEAVIFLHNMGEFQVAGSLGLMQECRVIGPLFLITKAIQKIGGVEKAGEKQLQKLKEEATKQASEIKTPANTSSR